MIKMRWKNWPSWVKGGIIGIIIAIILSLIVILFGEYDNLITFLIGFGIFTINFWLAILINCNIESCFISDLYIFMIVFIIEFYVVGSIIGLLIGKLRKRGKK